jgi:glycine betaine/proline transport system ATP-binding protein
MESGRIVQYGKPQEIVLNPANDYVRDFVAHMNPLNVLRAQEVMQPFASLPRAGSNGSALVDEGLTLNASGVGQRDGVAMPLVALENVDTAPHRAFIAVGGNTPLRALIDARLKHTGPFVVRENGAITGLIRDEDLFRCLQARAEGKTPTPM